MGFSNRAIREVKPLSFIYEMVVPGPCGETEFPLQGVLVRPAQGKLVLFPSFWTRVHRGVTLVTGVKYIATTWICFA